MEKTQTTKRERTGLIDALFAAGAHFGFVKSRRHPSTKSYIFGVKDKTEIFNLEKTSGELSRALEFIESKGREGAYGLWVGGKSEARSAVEKAGKTLEMPFVNGRWIGGTLTNFPEIKKRLARLEELLSQKERGELAKYTKKERLLIDREIDKLTIYFGGITGMKSLPKFMVIVDPKKEKIALAEARRLKIPVIAIAGSDTNIYELDYAIPANDASRQSISFITNELVEAYKLGRETALKEKPETKE